MTPNEMFKKGFITKCAEYGVDPELMAKEAGLATALRLGFSRVSVPLRKLRNKLTGLNKPGPISYTEQTMSLEEALRRIGQSQRSSGNSKAIWTPSPPVKPSVYTTKPTQPKKVGYPTDEEW